MIAELKSIAPAEHVYNDYRFRLAPSKYAATTRMSAQVEKYDANSKHISSSNQYE